jgi:hypothetical protein
VDIYKKRSSTPELHGWSGRLFSSLKKSKSTNEKPRSFARVAEVVLLSAPHTNKDKGEATFGLEKYN